MSFNALSDDVALRIELGAFRNAMRDGVYLFVNHPEDAGQRLCPASDCLSIPRRAKETLAVGRADFLLDVRRQRRQVSGPHVGATGTRD